MSQPSQLRNATRSKTPTLDDLTRDLALLSNPNQKKALEQVFKHCPSKYRLFLAVFRREATRNQCIKAKCLDCSGLQPTEIAQCAATACPLWDYRPYQKNEEPEQDWTCCQQCGKQTDGERRCEECSPDHNKEEE